MAAVALVIGIVIQQAPVEPAALDWQEIVSFGGQSVAALILDGAGLYGAWLVRRRCDDALTPQPTPTGGRRHALRAEVVGTGPRRPRRSTPRPSGAVRRAAQPSAR